ncbi:MAG: TonB-dependent receptor [Gammaproteobacteria bacterium]
MSSSIQSRRPRYAAVAAAMALATALSAGARAQETEELEQIDVIGVTPTHGVGLPKEKIPVNVQSATAEDLDRQHSLDLSDYMNRNLGSVNLNAAQTNVLQSDVQYRGFTASPLLGLPQGLAVYVNGVRVNEVFGDTVNWDLLPESMINSINLVGGANPVFGLNTLGGALSIQTKNGFTNPGLTGEAYGGSFGRIVANIESGGNNGTLGYFLNLHNFVEDGWRDDQPSNAFNIYGTVGWRTAASTLDLQYFHANTDLTGNGPLPVEQLEIDRESFFTAPDITKNHLRMLNLEGTHWFTDTVQFSGNAYYRYNRADSFNGDGTPYEECEFIEGEFLVAEEDAFACDGTESIAALTPDQLEELVRDEAGDLIDGDFDAINNQSERDQRSYGGSAQTTFLNDVFGRENQLIAGAAYTQGLVEYRSLVEAAQLDANRVTTRTGIIVDGEDTLLNANTRTWSLYLTDTFSITPDIALTLAGRYNNTRIQTTNVGDPLDEDGDGVDDLSGDHVFTRFNPAVGITWQAMQTVNVYGSYSESARAPTPVELSCADPDAPCLLPNAFLADPPLEQVVAKSFEGGARGQVFGNINWNLGGFYTTNVNDIIFLATGGVTGNQGYFDNVGDTRRTGMELGLSGLWNRLSWFANYSFVHATFEDEFVSTTPNHPLAGPDGTLPVEEGDRIPGIPQHSLKLGADYQFTQAFSFGGDLVFNSGQYLRGDEANLLDTTDAYAIVNIRGEYRFGKHVSAFAVIENLFDTDYETFGLLGEANEVFPNFTDNRFFGPGAPIGGWFGIKISM